MSKINVKNNHTSTLSVAGVEISPGAEAAVEEVKLKQWANGNAAKIWMEQGIITPGEGFDPDASDNEDDGEGGEGGESGEDDRDSLVAQATALGLEFAPNLGVKKLKALIEAKQAEDNE